MAQNNHYSKTFEGLKWGRINGDEDIDETFFALGFEDILFTNISCRYHEKRGQFGIEISDRIYKPGVADKRGKITLNSRKCRDVQFYIDDTPIYHAIVGSWRYNMR